MTPTRRTSVHRYPFSRRHLLVAPLSPIGVALISYMFFIICTVFPPNSYKAIMREPDWMFLNSASIVFVTICVIGYIAGVLLMMVNPICSVHVATQRYLGRVAILLPLTVAFALNFISVLLIARQTPDLFITWYISGRDAKRNLDTTGALSLALPLLYASCWWAMWQIMNREQICARRSVSLRAALFVAFLAALITSIIKVARYDLMPMIFGLALVYLVFKLGDRRTSVRRYIMFVSSLIIAIVTLFLLFSWLRGSESQSGFINNGMGYTAASYNRLAGVLDGRIYLPYRGTGTYIFDFASNLPLLGRWTSLGMPDSTAVWLSEFSAVSSGGLDGGYNLVSAFGYVYEDMGWASPLYFVVIGGATMWAWRRLRAGRASGVFLYPWLAFSVLYWFGNNIVARPQLIVIIGAAILLSVYERFTSKRAPLQEVMAIME